MPHDYDTNTLNSRYCCRTISRVIVLAICSSGSLPRRVNALSLNFRLRMKSMAVSLRIPVIALAQLYRVAASERPQLHHLAETGDIEHEADQVILIDRREGDAVLILANNRHGPQIMAKVAFSGQFTSFNDVA